MSLVPQFTRERSFYLLLCFENVGRSPDKLPPLCPLQIKTCRGGCSACCIPSGFGRCELSLSRPTEAKNAGALPSDLLPPKPQPARTDLEVPKSSDPNPIHVTSLFAAKFTCEGKKIPQPGNVPHAAISSSPHVVLGYRFKEHSCGVSRSFPLVLPREELVRGETAPQQSRSSKGLLWAGRGNV